VIFCLLKLTSSYFQFTLNASRGEALASAPALTHEKERKEEMMTPRTRELFAKIRRDLERDMLSQKIVDEMKRAAINPYARRNYPGVHILMIESAPIDAAIETCLTAERVLSR
jgi:hypothetical protein